MEALFSINLAVNGFNVVYRVFEERGKYVFLSENSANAYHNFSFVRKDEKWVELELELVYPELKKQAVTALNKYVLTEQ
ncbi:MAG: hypothetical protein ACR2KB_01630 [Chitinophagaceae bacterium]